MRTNATVNPNRWIGILLLILTLGFTAMEAHAQPSLSKVFTPNIIGPGSVSTITFTINNDGAPPVTDLAFTDVLPGPIDFASPVNASTTCLNGAVSVSASPNTITFSDGEVSANSICTVTVNVTASTPGMHTNPAITLSSSAGTSMSSPVDLTVATDRPGVSKSFMPSTIPLGGRSTLTITIDNSANASVLSSLVVTDNLPVGMVIANPANASTTCGGPDPTFTAVTGTSTITFSSFGFPVSGFEVMLAGETCTITVDVTGTGGGSLGNITEDVTVNTSSSSGKASAVLDVTVTPIALSKMFTDDPVPPGDPVTLEFTINNFDRTASATGIAFTDDLDAALTGLLATGLPAIECGGTVSTPDGGETIAFSDGTLGPEGSCTFSVSLTVPPTAPPGAYTNTTSAITATVGGSMETGNMASDDLFVEPVPKLTKEFIDDPAVAGSTVTLRFTIENTSSTTSATDITFKDEFHEVLPTASMVPANGSACGTGSTFTFTPLINPPPPNSVTPATLTLTGGELDPSGTCTFDITLDVISTAAAGTYPNITSVITATVEGATRVGAPASDNLAIITAPSLIKEFTDDPVQPGGTVTLEFTLLHDEDSPADATMIGFMDDLTAMGIPGLASTSGTLNDVCGNGSTFGGTTMLVLSGGTLAPGGSCTFSVTLAVPPGAPRGTFTNTTGTVMATVSETAITGNTATDDLLIPALLFSKAFIGDPLIAGSPVTLRFTLDNVGDDDATGISFSDALPDVLPGSGASDLTLLTALPASFCGGTLIDFGGGSLSFIGGSVTAGTDCSFDVDLEVPAGTSDGTFINTTSSLTTTIDGSVFVIDPATAPLIVNSTLLGLIKEFTDDPVAPGDAVNLRFTLTNLDAVNTASDIDFTDDLDAVLSGLLATGLPFSACGGTVSTPDGGMTIEFSGGSLTGGEECSFDVSLTVPAGTTPSIYPNTTSSLTGTITSLPVTGGAASDDLEIIQLVDFSKSFDGPTVAGATATLTFTITNPGADLVSDLDFTDNLDDVISGLEATSLPTDPCGEGSSITGTGLLTFSGGELAPMGGTCSFDVDVTVPATATAGTFPNITSDLTLNGLKVSDPATADLTVEPPPTFDKVFSPDAIPFEGTSTLTFTIDNSASSFDAIDLTFTDNLPADVEVADPANATTDCTGGTLTAAAGTMVISYSGGAISAGASCTISLDVTGIDSGTHTNLTDDLTSSSGNSGTATDDLMVEGPLLFSKAFNPGTIGPGSVAMLTFTITNSIGVGATDLAFTDDLPDEITIAEPAAVVNNCGGTVTALPGGGAVTPPPGGGTATPPTGGGTITLTDGMLTAGSSCTITVNVTSSTGGTHTNTTSDLTSSLPSSGPATADLTVATDRPGFTKSFSPNPVGFGGRSTLTLTIDNSANGSAVTGLDFTDNLPPGMTVADPANASTDCTGGVLTATPGSSLISYSPAFLGDASVAAGTSCTVSVDVVGGSLGSLGNTTDVLTSSAGTSGKAGAVLEVTGNSILLTKEFIDDPVAPGGTVTLEFTIRNTSRTSTATDIAFSDDVRASGAQVTLVAPPGLPTTSCGGFGSSFVIGVFTVTGLTLDPEESCTFSIQLTVPAGTAPGTYPNTTSSITATIDGMGVTGDPATDDLFVEAAGPTLTKTFLDNPAGSGGTTRLEFTITNTNSTSTATDITFEDEFDAVMPTASVVPADGSACGAGSDFTFTPLLNPPPPSTSTPATLTLTGGELAPSASCTFEITLDIEPGAAAGLYPNTTSEITATVDGMTVTGDPATDDLEIVGVPSLTKTFTDDPVDPGTTVTLEFTLAHDEDAPGDATDIAFTDDLDATLAGLLATGLPISACGGTLSTPDGGMTIAFSGGTLMPGEVCTFSITLDVPGTAPPGPHTNTTSDITATVSGVTTTGNPASDDLDISSLTFTKAFTDDPVVPGSTVTLAFTLENVSPSDDATGIAFQDNLDQVLSGLAVVPASVPAMPCGAGSSITLSAGDTFIQFAGGSLTAGSSCTFSVTLDVPAGAASDTYINTTQLESATIGGSTIGFESAIDELVVSGNLLELTKEFTDDPVAPGGTVNLRFTLTNLDATNAASDIAFEDDLDAVLTGLLATGLPVSGCGGTAATSDGGMTIAFTGGSLAGGGTCFFDVSVTVPGGITSGTHTNTTTGVTGTINSLGATGDPATDDLIVSTTAVAFTKSFDGPTTATGTPVLTFTIINTDTGSGISGFGFTDNLDAVISGLVSTSGTLTDICGSGSSISGTSSLLFTGGDLGPDDSCSFDVTLAVPDLTPADTYTNTTSELQISGLPIADPATADLTVEPAPTFAKVFDPDAILFQGISTLTFTIDNTDSALDATDLAFTDNLPAGVAVADPANATTDCTDGTLTADAGTDEISYSGGTVGAGASCTISADVTGTASGTHTNVTGDLTSSSGTSGTATDDLDVEDEPALTVTKTDALVGDVDDDGKADPGDTIEYTVVITNSGGGAANVVYTDTVDGNTTLDCTTNTPTTTEGSVTTCDDAGGVVTVDVGTLAGSSSVTITYQVIVDDPIAAGVEEVCNQGTASGGNFADLMTNDPDTGDPDDATCMAVDAEPDLTLTKDDGGATMIPGNDVPYTLTYANDGNQDATGVEITETVPDNTTYKAAGSAAWSCADGSAAGTTCTLTIGDLAAGSGGTALFVVTVDSPVPAGTDEIENTASIDDDDANGDDPTPENNEASDTTPVDAEPDVSATKTDALVVDLDSDGLVDPGDTIEYTIVITNSGNEGAATVVLTDTPGDNTTLVVGSVVAPGGTIIKGNTAGDTMVEVSFDEIDGEPRGPGTATVIFRVVVDIPFPADEETVENQGSIAFLNEARVVVLAILTDDPDTPVLDDPTATVIDRSSDLSLTKTVDNPTPTAFTNVVFKLTLKNGGPVASTVEVSDLLPEGLTFISADPAKDYLSESGEWKISEIAVGDSSILLITARVDDFRPRTNIASITLTSFPDPDLSNNADSVTVTATVLSKEETAALTLEEAEEIPTEFELGPNYPNPFNPETVIPVGIPEASTVTVTVYDVLGRRVASLYEGTLVAGWHKLTWHASNQPTGIYFVRMQTESLVKTRRVTLMK